MSKRVVMRRQTMSDWSKIGWTPATAVVLVVSLCLSGCMPIWQGRELEEELAEMEARQAELDAEAQEREEALAEMIEDATAEIEELEEVLEEARKILARDSAELGEDVRRSRQELSQVRGQLEELEFHQRRNQQAFETFRDDMDTRFEDVEPEELLEMVEKFQEDGELDFARRALEQFLSDYEDHELAPEARLELGEIYFQTEKWESAVEVFQELRDDETSEARQARATRRIGEIFRELGNCDNAELFLESVIEDYPNSDEVSEVRGMLSDIEGGNCP